MVFGWVQFRGLYASLYCYLFLYGKNISSFYRRLNLQGYLGLVFGLKGAWVEGEDGKLKNEKVEKIGEVKRRNF